MNFYLKGGPEVDLIALAKAKWCMRKRRHHLHLFDLLQGGPKK